MRTVAQTAFLMAVLTLVSKCIGFLREMVMASYYGASYVTDAYVMASTILSVLFGGILAAVSIAYLPIYSDITEKKGEAEGDRFTSSVINALLVITVLISLIGILFSDIIVSLFASGFTGETAQLASFYIKILFSYVIFSSTAGILDSYLQYKGYFLPQIISGYFVSIGTIAAIIVSACTSYYYLACGLLIGYGLRFLCIWLVAKRKNYRHSYQLGSRENISLILTLALPTYIGSSMYNINSFVDKTMASPLSEGSIAALNYAYLLNNMIMSVTIIILSTIIYPKLTKLNSMERYDSYNTMLKTGLNLVVLIAMPCSLGAMVFSNEMIQLVYGRGAFDDIAVQMTSSAFFYYSIGLVFTALNKFLTKVFYSLRNMKSPMFYSAASVVINICLNLVFIRYMGLKGIALSTSIASLANCIMKYYGLKKYGHIHLIGREAVKELLKIVVLSALAVALSYLFFISTEVIRSDLLHLALAILFGGTAYFLLLYYFKVKEVKLIIQMLLQRKKRR